MKGELVLTDELMRNILQFMAKYVYPAGGSVVGRGTLSMGCGRSS